LAEDKEKRRQEAEQQRETAEKKLNEIKSANEPRDVEHVVYSSPVHIRVTRTPVDILISQREWSVAPGQTIEVPVSIRRKYGFQGQVELALAVPQASAVAASPVVLGTGQDHAKLVLTTAAETPSGVYAAVLESHLTFNKVVLLDKQQVSIKVLPAPKGAD
jgi:hypothetical protein